MLNVRLDFFFNCARASRPSIPNFKLIFTLSKDISAKV